MVKGTIGGPGLSNDTSRLRPSLRSGLRSKNISVRTRPKAESRTNFNYVGLTPKQAKKLVNLAKKQGKTESKVLRKMLDSYLKRVESKGLPFEPYRKFSPIDLEVLPRTIRKDQDARLRELMKKTGRKISELARQAVDKF